jgi:hypothetical protein
MEIICVVGPVPGRVTATVSHEGEIRQLPMDIASHRAGGWQARRPNGDFGLRCHSVNTAILLEAGDAFVRQPQTEYLAAD